MEQKLISHGELVDQELLKCSLVIGKKNGDVLYKTTDIKFGNLSENIPDINIEAFPKPLFQFTAYHHRWACNIFNSCESSLNWSAFCKNEADSRTITWDIVEIGVNNSNVPFGANDIGTQPHYKHLQNQITTFSVGWKKGGKDLDFYSGIKCYLGDYWWFWLFYSHAD